ncbi:Ohr family peroxiredoxin [Methylobacterium sp. WL64]|uniref:Ohr family peroxiredoxin n=1 Tax=Methylobacterium sp. WL64 TaxID=2603894 RepID=UPI0011C961C6|nr:Ohr family peroxiredoxin [Methylobacterium sp. WL64]TXM98846.1 Ohr family peroxiredoxin [Methylobacterium sp. WL64]
MKILHSARVTATGGRRGRAVASNGAFDVRFVAPIAQARDPSAGHTPEQLFAACFSACFLEAIQTSAKRRSAKLASDSTVTAQVGIGRRGDGIGFGLDVGLTVSLPEIDPRLAHELVEEAQGICAYTHATRGGIDLRITVS